MKYVVVKCNDNSVYIIRSNKPKSRFGKVIIGHDNSKGNFERNKFMFRGKDIHGNPKILGEYKTKKLAISNHIEEFI